MIGASERPGHLEQFGGTVHVVGSHHHVDVPRTLGDEVLVLLGQAPGDHDLAAFALTLPGLEVAEVAVQLVVGVLADAAGVEHDHVGLGLRARRGRARRPRAVRRCARNRARSSGTRRCARCSCGTWTTRLLAMSAPLAPLAALRRVVAPAPHRRAPCSPSPATDNYDLYRCCTTCTSSTAIAAFGPLFVYPRLQRLGDTEGIARLHVRFVMPALVVMWVVGMGMAGVAKFSIGSMHWLTITILLWLIACWSAGSSSVRRSATPPRRPARRCRPVSHHPPDPGARPLADDLQAVRRRSDVFND